MAASEETALYRAYGEAGQLLYIGISSDFGKRWKQHARTQLWWPEKHRLTTIWFDSRPEAREAEIAAIKAEHPKHNQSHNGVCIPRRPLRSSTDRRPALGELLDREQEALDRWAAGQGENPFAAGVRLGAN